MPTLQAPDPFAAGAHTPLSWVGRAPGDLEKTLGEVRQGMVEPVVALARQAFPEWSKESLNRRLEALQKCHARLRSYDAQLTDILCAEIGMPPHQATQEVERALAFFEVVFDEVDETLKSQNFEKGGVVLRCRRIPRGPAVVIAPATSPLALPLCAMLAHLVVGNTVILKPSPYAALSADELVQLMKLSFPEGAIQCLQGGGSEGLRAALHTRVAGVWMAGRRNNTQELAQQLLAYPGKELCLAMGGKNTSIVCADADLDMSVPQVAEAAFSLAGQSCLNTPQVVVAAERLDEFLEKFSAELEHWQPGSPWKNNRGMGPMLTEEAVRHYEEFANLVRLPWLVEPKFPGELDGKLGYYVTPSCLVCRSRREKIRAFHADLAQRELRAPVLQILVSNDLHEAVDIHNESALGFVTSVYTRSESVFWQVADTVQAGVLIANQASTQVSVELPWPTWQAAGNRRSLAAGSSRYATNEQAIQIRKDRFLKGQDSNT
ncbi:MAG: aldehyde dehydrogenase family protein [Verrucomicrobiales bacterium]